MHRLPAGPLLFYCQVCKAAVIMTAYRYVDICHRSKHHLFNSVCSSHPGRMFVPCTNEPWFPEARKPDSVRPAEEMLGPVHHAAQIMQSRRYCHFMCCVLKVALASQPIAYTTVNIENTAQQGKDM